MGLLGEYAVAESLGLSTDTEVTITGDGGYGDLTYHDGRMIGVKTNMRRGGRYRLPYRDVGLLYDDLLVLCWPGDEIVQDASIDIVGYLTRQQFMDTHVIDKLGYPSVAQEDMEPFEELVDHAKRLRGLTVIR